MGLMPYATSVAMKVRKYILRPRNLAQLRKQGLSFASQRARNWQHTGQDFEVTAYEDNGSFAQCAEETVLGVRIDSISGAREEREEDLLYNGNRDGLQQRVIEIMESAVSGEESTSSIQNQEPGCLKSQSLIHHLLFLL
ncbi:hypothetical protein DPMN_086526 [Dreissena polymorpha]|uniref:Uncharacterized protein n=1 Tax=Dreissena polymorpha TaxID=45954 RepID=A0A9D4KRD1_DREPO|nr:hypothetical protein DPMN_086526 [Dreissena polymorpha]